MTNGAVERIGEIPGVVSGQVRELGCPSRFHQFSGLANRTHREI